MSMSTFLIDAAVVAVFALIVAISTYRGLASYAKGILALICTFLICRIFGGMVGEWLDDAFFGEIFSNKVNDILTDTLGNAASSVKADELFASIPGFFKSLLGAAGADIAGIEEYMANFEGNFAESIGLMADKIAAPISAFVSSLVGYILLFIVAFFAAKILSFLLVKLMELPVLSTVNRVGGFALGLVAAYIVCWLGCSLGGIVVGFIAPETNLADTLIFAFFAW